MKVQVKVMLSYDFCHFEHSLSLVMDADTPIKEVMKIRNELRIECMKLCQEAIRQYKIYKFEQVEVLNNAVNSYIHKKEVKEIKLNIPKSEWTEGQKARVKALEDFEYLLSQRSYFQYEDDIQV